MRQRFPVLLMCVLVAWASVAFVLQARDVMRRPISIPDGPVMLWRSGGVHVERWTEFLDEVAARVPEGATILVDADTIDPSDEFFLSLWCAYFLPRHNVIRRSNEQTERPARYVLTTNGEASLIPERPTAEQAIHGTVLLAGVGKLVLLEPEVLTDEAPSG